MSLGVLTDDIASDCAFESVVQLWKAGPKESCVRWSGVAGGVAALGEKEGQSRDLPPIEGAAQENERSAGLGPPEEEKYGTVLAVS